MSVEKRAFYPIKWGNLYTAMRTLRDRWKWKMKFSNSERATKLAILREKLRPVYTMSIRLLTSSLYCFIALKVSHHLFTFLQWSVMALPEYLWWMHYDSYCNCPKIIHSLNYAWMQYRAWEIRFFSSQRLKKLPSRYCLAQRIIYSVFWWNRIWVFSTTPVSCEDFNMILCMYMDLVSESL